eukprot:2818391-Lingulodinium_polyedra.AAC.1
MIREPATRQRALATQGRPQAHDGGPCHGALAYRSLSDLGSIQSPLNGPRARSPCAKTPTKRTVE